VNVKEYQELIRKAPELANFFQYVAPSKHRPGHFRAIRRSYYSREARSTPLLRAELHFAKTAYNSYGEKGFDEKGMPIVASKCADAMRGKEFKDKRNRVDEAIEKLRKSLIAISQVV